MSVYLRGSHSVSALHGSRCRKGSQRAVGCQRSPCRIRARAPADRAHGPDSSRHSLSMQPQPPPTPPWTTGFSEKGAPWQRPSSTKPAMPYAIKPPPAPMPILPTTFRQRGRGPRAPEASAAASTAPAALCDVAGGNLDGRSGAGSDGEGGAATGARTGAAPGPATAATTDAGGSFAAGAVGALGCAAAAPGSGAGPADGAWAGAKVPGPEPPAADFSSRHRALL